MDQKRTAIFAITASFLLGVAAGYFLLRLTGVPAQPPSGFYRLKNELRQRLSLTGGQQNALDSLLQRRRVVFDSFRSQMANEFGGMRKVTRDSIRMMLTEEQKKGFEVFIQELDREREQEKGPAR